MSANHRFGGDWTANKLSRLRAYLIAFNHALRNRPFARWYLDAFAGCGYIDTSEAKDSELVFPGFSDSDSQGFLMVRRESRLKLSLRSTSTSSLSSERTSVQSSSACVRNTRARGSVSNKAMPTN